MKAEEREKKRDNRRELAEILFDTPSHVTDPAFNAVIEWMLKREAAAYERGQNDMLKTWGNNCAMNDGCVLAWSIREAEG